MTHARALITDHLFRTANTYVRQGYGPCSRIDPGNCSWLGTCNRPAADHIDASEFRRRRGTA